MTVRQWWRWRLKRQVKQDKDAVKDILHGMTSPFYLCCVLLMKEQWCFAGLKGRGQRDVINCCRLTVLLMYITSDFFLAKGRRGDLSVKSMHLTTTTTKKDMIFYGA